MHMRREGWVWVAVLLALSAGSARAQTIPGLGGGTEQEQAADTAEAATPEPLPDALDVAMRASQIADSATVAERTIEEAGRTESLRADLADAARRHADLDALLESLSGADYVRPERVSRLRDQAVLEDQRLQALRDRVLGRLEELGSVRSAWTDRQEFWQRWQAAIQGDPDAAAVAPDMRLAIARIDTVLARVSATLDGLLEVQRGIADLRASNEQVRATLTVMRSGGRAALFQRDQPLLLSAEHRSELADGRWRAWTPAAALRPSTYPAFVRDHAGILLFHLVLIIIAGLLARRLRANVRTVGDWSGLLQHPWLLAVFVSVVMAIQRVLLAPPLWDVILWALFGISAAVLARQLFAAKALRLTVYLFAAFYPVFILSEVVQFPAPVFRLAIAAVAAVGLPVFAVLARQRTAIARAENVSDPRRIWPLRIGALMWAVVLGAVVLGYDSLGRWILHASVTSGAVIFVVIVFLRLIHGVVATLVISDPGIRRHLALRVAVRLVQRLTLLIRVVAVIGAVLILLDVWQLAESPIATWQRITDAGFDVGPIRITIGRILLGILVVYIAVLISWLLRNVAKSEVYQRWDLDRGVGDSINMLLHYILITAGVIAALAVLGVELRNFAIIAGALGIGIGFGLQNVVSNFAAGLILLFERPVRAGDTVVVGEEWGTITRIGLRSTVMLTFDQSEMIVPNADLVSEKVVNWTLTNPTARIIVEVGVAYGSDVAAVLRILTESAGAHPATMSEPPPQPLFVGFGDSSLDFELRVWVSEIRSRFEVRSAILADIDRRLAEAGIEIPFPQRDLHVRSVDEGAARALGGRAKTPPESGR